MANNEDTKRRNQPFETHIPDNAIAATASIGSNSTALTEKRGMVVAFQGVKGDNNNSIRTGVSKQHEHDDCFENDSDIVTTGGSGCGGGDDNAAGGSEVSSLGVSSSLGGSGIVSDPFLSHLPHYQQQQQQQQQPEEEDIMQQHLSQSALMTDHLRRSIEASSLARLQSHPLRYGRSVSRLGTSHYHPRHASTRTTTTLATTPDDGGGDDGGGDGDGGSSGGSLPPPPIGVSAAAADAADAVNGGTRTSTVAVDASSVSVERAVVPSKMDPKPRSFCEPVVVRVDLEPSFLNEEKSDNDDSDDSHSRSCGKEIEEELTKAPQHQHHENSHEEESAQEDETGSMASSQRDNSGSQTFSPFHDEDSNSVHDDDFFMEQQQQQQQHHSTLLPNEREEEVQININNHSDSDNDDYGSDTNTDDPDSDNDDYGSDTNTDDPSTVNNHNDYYQHEASRDSKFESYACLVDPNQDDRAVEIHLHSLRRPHMRAFHLAWMSFFIAFFTWFSITPLLSEVARSLQLDRREIWTSSTFAVAGSAVTRILIGPICDKYGARWAMSGTLILSAIPTALTGLVNSARGLYVLRLVIGVAGSAFVTSQYWTSCMFTVEVAGAANAVVAGWGNLGGGVTQIVMGSLFFPLFKIIYGGSYGRPPKLETTGNDQDSSNTEYDEGSFDRPSDLAWRTVCVIPAVMCVCMAFVLVRNTDDSPKGNYRKRRKDGLMSVSAKRAMQTGLSDWNTWILFIQYGCCFGVEITMVNAAALYFEEEFGQSLESAAAIASIFGWMNLFARGIGGFVSDISNASYGMRGRLTVQTIFLLLEGAAVIVFSKTQTLGGAIAVMIVFSIFVQGAEGSTFGIVPCLRPSATGSVAGIVGAGGNFGGVGFSLLFREYNYRQAFTVMGIVAMGSAAFSLLITVKGHSSLLWGADAPEVLERRQVHSENIGNIPSIQAKGELDVESSFRCVDKKLSSSAPNQTQELDGGCSRQDPATIQEESTGA